MGDRRYPGLAGVHMREPDPGHDDGGVRDLEGPFGAPGTRPGSDAVRAHGPVIAAVAQSLAYLRSDAGRASIARDPYWPKWDSPWWHVLALREAGQPELVPREVLVELAEAATRHYLPFFPRPPEVLPPGKSARTDVIARGSRAPRCVCGPGPRPTKPGASRAPSLRFPSATPSRGPRTPCRFSRPSSPRCALASLDERCLGERFGRGDLTEL